MNPTIRFATPDDVDAIRALIMDLMPMMTIHPDAQGAEQFLESFGVPAMQRYVSAPNFRYQLAFVEGELAGVAAVRDNSHLFHLFVARRFHGQGLGRVLWKAAYDDALSLGNPGQFTVNSSVYAFDMYRHFGFEPTSGKIEQHGIAYIPMRLAV
ncbi:GNAT family N-acetyltransferase [Massilia endophytica]|uniref:GNAT family N-acetyltransferase n=1 Tax=Massilia endophytica TaxID=2899220 RepID=UPI001E62EF9F|nr:GNAT family N-acetyltransferase [Massilia endophytica]UGQ45139.1 GNAT family N-acetyltransferase [Massilia endophytica]